MSDLVGNPEDRFSRVTAQMSSSSPGKTTRVPVAVTISQSKVVRLSPNTSLCDLHAVNILSYLPFVVQDIVKAYVSQHIIETDKPSYCYEDDLSNTIEDLGS